MQLVTWIIDWCCQIKCLLVTHLSLHPFLSLKKSKKLPPPYGARVQLTRYHPTFPVSSQSTGFSSSCMELPINAGTRRDLTQGDNPAPARTQFLPDHIQSGIPSRFSAPPVLCKGLPDLLIRSSEIKLLSKIYPKAYHHVKSPGALTSLCDGSCRGGTGSSPPG